MIAFQNINKTFKTKTILKDISFTINEGQIIKITGSNGCGKSTLLKIACGLIKPTSGQVIYDKYQNHIGALTENPSFIEDDNIYNNLKYLYNLKNTFDENKVATLCQQMHLDLYEKLPMKEYSIGMRQKVAFIQAVMEDQKIIYLDEPTRGMDEESVQQFYQMIEQLHNENKTIIICTHEKLESITFDKEYQIDNGIIS